MALAMQTRMQLCSKPATAPSVAARTTRVSAFAGPRLQSRVMRRNMVVRAEEGFGGEKGDSSDTLQGVKVADNNQQDSFQKIEAPVRDQANPSDGGPAMEDRLGANDKLFVQEDGAKEKALLGTEVALSDAMRFKGAAPEIINSRLAMLGFIAALGAELFTGKTVFEQTAQAPNAIIATFVIFTIATLVPILRGVPRRGGKEMGGLHAFTSNAELINGRLAIIGFPCLLIQEYIMKAPTFPHIF